MHLDEKNMVSHVSEKAKSIWAGEYFHPYEIIPPLTRIPFGPLYISAPRNAHEILNRMYGHE
jgi:phosphorylcholine metabolism protein LicD